MADVFLAGTVGYFKLGATAMAFGKWTATFESNPVSVNNYTGGGYNQMVPGIIKGTVKASGPYNFGSMGITVGASGTFHMGLQSPSSEITFPGYITKVELESDVDGRVSINIEGQSSGAFTASVT